MSGATRLLRGGLVPVSPDTGAIGRVLPFQYNPDTLSRTLVPRGMGSEGDRSEALRLAGPAAETIKLDAEFDASPAAAGEAGARGVAAQLAALEGLVNPSVADLRATAARAQAGTIEIAPVEAPLLLFVWGADRVMPVRITDYQVSEEGFTAALAPLRAKVSLGLRVLSVADLPSAHRGANMFLAYRAGREAAARTLGAAGLAALGLTGIG